MLELNGARVTRTHNVLQHTVRTGGVVACAVELDELTAAIHEPKTQLFRKILKFSYKNQKFAHS